MTDHASTTLTASRASLGPWRDTREERAISAQQAEADRVNGEEDLLIKELLLDLSAVQLEGQPKGTAFTKVGLLEPSHFRQHKHREIYRSIQAVCRQLEEPDVQDVLNDLSARGVLADVGGTSEVAGLALDVPHTGHVSRRAKVVRENGEKRMLRERVRNLQAACDDPSLSLDDLIDQADGITARVEGNQGFRPMRAIELYRQNPEMKPEVVEGLIRRGEVCNLVSVSKAGKTWLSYGLATAVQSGQPWLGFPTRRGAVLILDAELHRPTLAWRFKTVCEASGFTLASADVDFDSLRGRWVTIPELPSYLRSVHQGRYSMVVIDAWYKFLPEGCEENSNSAMARMFTILDQLAQQLDVALVVIHHSSKGSQAEKRVVDVGAGASAQSRSADTHLVLREHNEPGVYVLDGETRSHAKFEKFCLQFAFPVWCRRDDLDPEDLKTERTKRRKASGVDSEAAQSDAELQDAADRETVYGVLVDDFPEGGSLFAIREECSFNESKTERLLKSLIDDGRAERVRGKGRAKWAYKPVILTPIEH